MNRTDHLPPPRRVALGAATAVTALLLGATVTGCQQSSETATHGFPQQPTTTTEETGLQETNSFGYIPEHETTLPTNGNGPGAPGPGDGGPFGGPGPGGGPFGSPPLPGGPGLPAAATLTTPAG